MPMWDILMWDVLGQKKSPHARLAHEGIGGLARGKGEGTNAGECGLARDKNHC